MKKIIVIALLAALMAVPGQTGRAAEPLPKPHPALGPASVVRIVMDALGHNDQPYRDRGIEVTFNFASPSNKAFTGPLARFSAMVRGPVYGRMLDHRGYKVDKVRTAGDISIIDVVLTTRERDMLGFRFTLTRQRGNDFAGSWMTDSVIPFEVVTL